MSLCRTLVSLVLVVALVGLLVAAVDADVNPIERLRNHANDGRLPQKIKNSRRPGPWYGGGWGGNNSGKSQWWLDRYGGKREECPPWFRIYGSTYCYKYWRYFENLDPWTARDIVHNTEPWW